MPMQSSQEGSAESPARREAGDDDEGNKSPASSASAPSMEEKERQIPVDPVSLRHLGMVADADPPLSAPSVLTETVARPSPLLPPLRRPAFVGASFPCSAASSPVHGSAAKPKRGDEHRVPVPATALHSAALAHYVSAAPAAPAALSRSASRAEGRSMAPHDDEDDDIGTGAHPEESFTCGALCMFIPGFSRKKPGAGAAVSSVQRPQHSARLASLERFECGSWSPPPPAMAHDVVASFALGAAKVSSCADDDDDAVKMAFAFDGGQPRGVLMMKKSASQRQEPVVKTTTAAGCGGEPRGILKKSASTTGSRRQQRQEEDSAATPRALSASQRHVRFSTASPSASPCVTPRLARARAEFNAFMEAQMA